MTSREYVASDALLSTGLRWVTAGIGTLFIFGVLALILFPRYYKTYEFVPQLLEERMVLTPIDLSTVIVVLLVVGVVLVAFAINGFRFTKVAAGGVSVDLGKVQKISQEVARIKDLERTVTDVDELKAQIQKLPRIHIGPAQPTESRDGDIWFKT